MNKERFSSKSRVGTMHEERFSPKLRVGTICDEERVSPKSRVGEIYDEDRFSPKLRVGTICDEERFSPKSRVGTMSEEERCKKSLTSSPLYHSTLDSLVDEDNVVRVTEDLKKIVEEHGRYISAHHDGLQTRNNRAAWGLAILVVILITIIAAFASAFAWKSSHIREMEDTVEAIKYELDKKIKAEVQSHVNHQVGYRSVWRESNPTITFEQLVFSSGNSQLDLETGIWRAGATGNYLVTLSAHGAYTPIQLQKDGKLIADMRLRPPFYDGPGVATKVVFMTAGGTLSLKTGDVKRLYGLFFSVSILGSNNVFSDTRRKHKSLGLSIQPNDDSFTRDIEDDNVAYDDMFHEDNNLDYNMFIENLEEGSALTDQFPNGS